MSGLTVARLLAAFMVAWTLSSCVDEEPGPQSCEEIADSCDFTQNYCEQIRNCSPSGPDYFVACRPYPPACEPNDCGCVMCSTDDYEQGTECNGDELVEFGVYWCENAPSVGTIRVGLWCE